MLKKYNFIIFTVVFVLSVSLVFCVGYFRKSVGKEAGKFNIELALNTVTKAKEVVYDIQNEGISKTLDQPEKISISAGHGSGVANISDQPLLIAIRVLGTGGYTAISSTNPDFDEETGCCTKPLTPGETLDVSINLDFPSKALDNYVVGKGKIEFLDLKSGKTLGEVPLKVINSKPRKSCCAKMDTTE